MKSMPVWPKDNRDALWREALARFHRGELRGAMDGFLKVVEMPGDMSPETWTAFLKIIDDLQSNILDMPPGVLRTRLQEQHSALEERTRLQGLAPIDSELQSILLLQLDFGSPAVAVSGTPGKSVRSELVHRVPHLDLSQNAPIQPGTLLKVEVYVDRLPARPGETSTEVIAESGAKVEVHLLASEHFKIIGEKIQTLVIREEEDRANAKPFELQVKSGPELPVDVPAGVTALFFYNERPSGKVSRAVEIAGVVKPVQQPSTVARIELQEAKPADLSVTIVAAPANDGRQFFCTVRSALLDAYKLGVSDVWNLPDVAEKLVHAYMGRFTNRNTKPTNLVAELRGAGISLFDASPKIFQKVFWELVDAGRLPTEIAIISEEPFIPWELMVPNRRKNGQPDKREPLGVEFRVGRWIPGDVVSPLQRISLRDSYVIAPKYDGRMALPFSQSEEDLVLQMFPGDPIKPATFEHMQETLKSRGRSLVHFVCHGKDDASGLQTIYLEQKEELSSAAVVGMDMGTTFADERPFVFLNACEVGRGTASLVGVGGFAKAFIDLGASGVIAPLWSVKDEIAHKVAEEFYNGIQAEPDTPLVEILRRIRAKAYDSNAAEDTYAAYSFYGDPAATGMRAP